MLNVVIFGAPGSGKGTQSEMITKQFELDHISTGDVLRAEIKAQTEIGKLADSYISKGNLVPDEVIVEMLEMVINEKKNCKGIIFDGFPRTIAQAEALKKMLKKREADVTVMLDLKVDNEELIVRLLERGKRSGRSDDNLETIKSRLEVYENYTAPLINHYKAEGKHIEVLGTGSIEAIFERIKKAINEVSGSHNA